MLELYISVGGPHGVSEQSLLEEKSSSTIKRLNARTLEVHHNPTALLSWFRPPAGGKLFLKIKGRGTSSIDDRRVN